MKDFFLFCKANQKEEISGKKVEEENSLDNSFIVEDLSFKFDTLVSKYFRRIS